MSAEEGFSNEGVPVELKDAFRKLGDAMNEFWPHAVRRIKARNARLGRDMDEHLKLGGVVRAVFHFQPQPAIALELIDHDGKPQEFWRFTGTGGDIPRVN